MKIVSISNINRLAENNYCVDAIVDLSPTDFTCFVSVSSLKNWKTNVVLRVAGRKIKGLSVSIEGIPNHLLWDSSKDKLIFAVGRHIQQLQKSSDRGERN